MIVRNTWETKGGCTFKGVEDQDRFRKKRIKARGEGEEDVTKC